MTSYKHLKDMPIMDAIKIVTELNPRERYNILYPSIGAVKDNSAGMALLKEHVHNAHTYVFDDDACKAVATLTSAEGGPIINKFLSDIRPPHNLFAFDLNNKIICTEGFKQPNFSLGTERVVYLCEVLNDKDWLIRVSYINFSEHGAMVSPIGHIISPTKEIFNHVTDQTSTIMKTVVKHFKDKGGKTISPLPADNAYVGFNYLHFNIGLRHEKDEDLPFVDAARCTNITVSPYTGRSLMNYINDNRSAHYIVEGKVINATASNMAEMAIYNSFRASMGSPRVLFAALLMFQLRDRIGLTAERKMGARYWYKGKQRPYLTHHNLTVVLPTPKIIERLRESIFHGGGWHNRRHNVRGHWRQSGRTGDANCGHRWEVRDNNPDKQSCFLCGRKRAFVKDFERGDAKLGYVTKEYHVETNRK